MRQKYLLKIAILFVFALFTQHSFSQILTENFDNDSNFAKSETFFSDGGSDYFGILDPIDESTNNFGAGSAPSGVPNFTGNTTNFLVGEDLDGDGASSTQTLTWSNLTITGYTDLNFSVKLGASSGFDAADEITLAVNIDGAGYNNIASFSVASGSNQFPTDGSVTLGLAMQTISGSISGSGTSIDLKLTVKANSGSEEFAVDDIVIGGTAGSSPTIGFDAATSSQTETDATFNVSIPITVSNYGTDQIDISVAVSGTAEVADYTLNTASLSFTADGSQNISLNVNPDSNDFDDEEIILTITETSSVTDLIISQATHTITVTEDETAPSIGFDIATSSETETDITFTSTNIPITVSNYSGTQIDINVSVTGGTAEIGDYTFTSPTALSFTADGSQNITLEINDDADTDGETVILTITETSSVNSLTISQSSHTLTISDDEIPPLPTSGTIFITEILDSDNGYTNDYLELFNNSNEEVSLYTSKLLRFSSDGVYEYSFDFGIDEATASVDLKIPAYGFLIIARGDTRAGFNTANSITLDAGVNYNGGNSDLYFGTGRRWKLKTGGTADTNDGDLIDDTLSGIGTAKDYRNIFTNTFITGATSDGTPGALEYLVYSGGAWVNTTAMDGTTAAKDAYIYDDYTVSANAAANNVGINTGKTLTVNSSIGLDVDGDLTVNGNMSINSGGSLIIDGSSTGNVTYNRTVDFVSGNLNGWYLMSSPVVGQDYNDGYVTANDIAEGTGANKGIATYTTASGSWDYFQSTESETFTSGKGYSVKRQTDTGTVSFTGTLNTNDAGVDFVLATSGTRINLLGNPYTSSISSVTLLGNAVLSGTQNIWIYDQTSGTNGGYAVSTLVDNFILAPGQGFFVLANLAGGTFNFAEANQSHNDDTFQKTTNTEIKVQISLDGFQNYAKVYYLDNATTGFDVGYEGEVFGGATDSFSIYSQLLTDKDEKKYQVQSLPNSDYESMVVPLGVKAAAGKEITFSSIALNLPTDIKVFLEDRFTNTFSRLDETNTEYKVTLTETLNGVGRFYMHTARSVLSTEEVILNSVRIFKTDVSTLKITGLPQGKTSFYLYNILGKEMMTTLFKSNGNKEIPLSKLASGIYLVKMHTEKGAISKKIILE